LLSVRYLFTSWEAVVLGGSQRAATQHTDRAYVIDPAGCVRRRYGTQPGPGTTAIKSSFAVLFADAARQAQPGR
jgi:hypothetical protein